MNVIILQISPRRHAVNNSLRYYDVHPTPYGIVREHYTLRSPQDLIGGEVSKN